MKKIKSYSQISDFNECIIQLAHNSIDAKSSFILISCDFESFHIEASDDGVGFSPDDLSLIGEQ